MLGESSCCLCSQSARVEMSIIIITQDELCTHRLENLRSIVSNGILATPLLKDEDNDSDEESWPIALSKERLLQSQPFLRLLLLPNSDFNFGKLTTHFIVICRETAVVGEDV